MASAASDSDLAATTCSCRTAESLSCYCQVGSAPSVREAQQYDERTECEHVDSKSLDLSTYPHAHLLGPALRRRSRPARLASSRAPARRTTHSVARRGARSAGRTTATADTGRGLGPTAIFQKRKKPSSLLKKPSSLTWREGKRQRLFRWLTHARMPLGPPCVAEGCPDKWRTNTQYKYVDAPLIAKHPHLSAGDCVCKAADCHRWAGWKPPKQSPGRKRPAAPAAEDVLPAVAVALPASTAPRPPFVARLDEIWGVRCAAAARSASARSLAD